MRKWLMVLVFFITACTPAIPSPGSPQASAAAPGTETLQISDTAVAASTTTPPLDEVRFPNPSDLQWTLVVDGLRKPVDLQHAGDGRIFVLAQDGLVQVLENGALRQEPMLDIRSRVGSWGSEQGLLGLAFHPDFEDNGYFFINYTDNAGNTIIARYRLEPGSAQADPDSEVILLRITQPYANHNGGGMAFGPDGYLYVATGDGGSAGDPLNSGQRLDTLLGKLLRLDVDGAQPYAIPPDNPFASGGGLPEIWAYGLRNPWRFAFDRASGDLYIGDVGQNQWEEVDFLPASSAGGANFGWNLREGSHTYAAGEALGLIDPVAEYDHSEGCSVTGGVVIRDPALSDWEGIYLYGDYCSGTIWGLLSDAQGSWHSMQLFTSSYNIGSFGEDASGVVYLLDLDGAVYRLQRSP